MSLDWIATLGLLDRYPTRWCLSLLPIEVLISIDLNSHLVLKQIVHQKLRHTVKVMLIRIVEFWILVPASGDLSFVLRLVHVELILTVNVAAEVWRKASDLIDFDFKV